MAEVLGFVEVAPDERVPPRDYEALAAKPVRAPPAWLTRFVASGWSARMRRGLVAAAALGCLLAADDARLAPVASGSRPYLASPVADDVPPMYFYAGDSRCPIGVACHIQLRARQDMWATYNRLFVGTATTSGAVWYEPVTGLVFSQELNAAGEANPAIMISLRERRIYRRGVLSFGPTIDLSSTARHDPVPGRRATPSMTRRSLTVTALRGPWLVTAVLSGPSTVALPLDAALHWVLAAPLPD